MTSVTVQSSFFGRVTDVPFDSAANLGLARQIAAAISEEVASGTATTAFSRDGQPSPVPGEGVFFQTGNGVSCLPHGYDAVVNTARNATIFGSGGRDEAVLSGNGNLTFIAAHGSGTVVTGGGRNDIETEWGDRGAWLIATGVGDDTINALGGGNDTIRTGAGHNVVTLGYGNDLVQLTGSDAVTASNGHDTVDATGGQSSLVEGGSSYLRFIGGAGGATIEGGCGSDTVYGGSGRLSVQGGMAGHNLLFAGTGSATLFGGGSGDRLYAQGGQGQSLDAGCGNETLSAAQSWGAVTLVGGSGRDLLIGGSGGDRFIAGGGTATMAGGAGADVFVFVDGNAGGRDVVLDFGGSDKVDLVGYGRNAVAAALASQCASGGSVTITLADHTKITFDGVSSLKANNFE